MQCPTHQILLDYRVDMLGSFCPWPDCGYVRKDLDAAVGTDQITPSLEDLFNGIRYEVIKTIDKVTITAYLPLGFSMPTFTRVYHLHDAKDLAMTETDYIELQKREMLKDLLERVKKERFGVS